MGHVVASPSCFHVNRPDCWNTCFAETIAALQDVLDLSVIHECVYHTSEKNNNLHDYSSYSRKVDSSSKDGLSSLASSTPFYRENISFHVGLKAEKARESNY